MSPLWMQGPYLIGYLSFVVSAPEALGCNAQNLGDNVPVVVGSLVRTLSIFFNELNGVDLYAR